MITDRDKAIEMYERVQEYLGSRGICAALQNYLSTDELVAFCEAQCRDYDLDLEDFMQEEN